VFTFRNHVLVAPIEGLGVKKETDRNNNVIEKIPMILEVIDECQHIVHRKECHDIVQSKL
jgi:hypothetical protein